MKADEYRAMFADCPVLFEEGLLKVVDAGDLVWVLDHTGYPVSGYECPDPSFAARLAVEEVRRTYRREARRWRRLEDAGVPSGDPCACSVAKGIPCDAHYRQWFDALHEEAS